MWLKAFVSRFLRLALVVLLSAILLDRSSVPAGDQTERVRAFTRGIEFDYVNWTLNALGLKLGQFVLGSDRYLSNTGRHATVSDYLDLVTRLQQEEARLNTLYANPDIQEKQVSSALLRRQINDLRTRRDRLAPVAEAILEEQISDVVARLDLALAGQPVPPVLYHSTPLPMALIVSPRSVIRQDEDISLVPDLTVDQQVSLESRVDRALNVSSLVVYIGGVGLYPTMVYQTDSLNYLSETVAHEWVHNFLTLRPLGANYLTSPQLRIMNETAASLAGKEIGRRVLELYYPELVPPSAPQPEQSSPEPTPTATPPAFDFNLEMRRTRIETDRLLAAGKIAEAESYLEQRRVVFWENGYALRKLNQAYFAFHGAYADHPSGGAAGEDPVGAAVRTLRSQSSSLADFLNRISWMWSFEQLQQAVQKPSR